MKNHFKAKTHLSLLNYLGDCISYDNLMHIDPKWADNILADGEEFATSPYNIKPDIISEVPIHNAD